mmetsp:Transcript_31731/g.68228  ORF Transcript_31731/g.68228 Transcript_31731/m.68228 type:complete len:191 (+) Transcript_31731:2231-2803(+)
MPRQCLNLRIWLQNARSSRSDSHSSHNGVNEDTLWLFHLFLCPRMTFRTATVTKDLFVSGLSLQFVSVLFTQIALSLFKTLSKGVPQVLMVLKDPVDRGWCNQCTFTHLKSTHRFLTSGGKVMLVCKRLRKLTQKRHRNLASLVLDGELEWPCKDDTRRTDGPIPRNTISPVQVDKRTVYRIGDLNFSPQ